MLHVGKYGNGFMRGVSYGTPFVTKGKPELNLFADAQHLFADCDGETLFADVQSFAGVEILFAVVQRLFADVHIASAQPKCVFLQHCQKHYHNSSYTFPALPSLINCMRKQSADKPQTYDMHRSCQSEHTLTPVL